MNNKIKLIGLFNESAANEEMPKRIKFEGDIFELDEDNVYKSSENGNFLTDSINFNLSNLNDYVEILEYEEEIERLDLNKVYFRDGTELVYKLMYSKINELVEKVNKLEKNKVDYIQPYKED